MIMKKILLKTLRNTFRYFFLIIILSTLTTFIRFAVRNPNAYKQRLWNLRNSGKNYKTILLWIREPGQEWDFLKEGDVTFIKNKCTFQNCYVTKDRELLDSYTKFDAIILDGKAISQRRDYSLPKKRYPRQLYIFASKQSSANYPVCDSKYDGYFNLTWTYKLDSDVVWPYFYVHDYENYAVAPDVDVKWDMSYIPVAEEFDVLVKEKEQAAIWISSNCFTSSRREMLVNNLKYYMRRKKLYLETVGTCGLNKLCHPENEKECLNMIYKYHFYFAFENALTEDYITDKVLKAFENYIVPVVFSGVNYTRFLPPHSYIDAGKLPVNETVDLLDFLINNHESYLEYFRWRNHYYIQQSDFYACELCKLINEKPRKVYKKFRDWWNPKKIKAYGRNYDPHVCRKTPDSSS